MISNIYTGSDALLNRPRKEGMKRFGIMGGTFDPIHHGHLTIAEWVREEYNLDKILFIPSGCPPHKEGRKVCDGLARFKMVEMAIDSNPYFEICACELQRVGYSYAIDTVRQLEHQYEEEVEWFFITGADAILELGTWKEAKQLVELCEFIAVIRSGYQLQEVRASLFEMMEDWQPKGIYIEHLPLIEISSTNIRMRIKKELSIRYLVPITVEKFIYQHHLYR